MPLTLRKPTGFAVMTTSTPGPVGSVADLGAGRDALLLRVSGRLLIDQRQQEIPVRRDPVADDVPLRAVPLDDPRRTAAFMILDRQLQRLHQPQHAELREPLVVDVQMLEAPL